METRTVKEIDLKFSDHKHNNQEKQNLKYIQKYSLFELMLN